VIVSVHQPHYLPWLGYFDKIDQSDLFVILDEVQYKKREYQNRNRIKSAGGELWLTVPVVTRGRYEQRMKEVEIDYGTDWRRKHLNAFELNYRRAGFFNEYFSGLSGFYAGAPRRLLAELNTAMTVYFMKEIGVKTEIVLESELGVGGTSTERIINICGKTGADVYLSGSGGKEYMNEQLFDEAGIKLVYQKYEHPSYRQLFGGFLPYMSIADLLFNEGPASLEIIRKGRAA